jgi:hypothetical protein
VVLKCNCGGYLLPEFKFCPWCGITIPPLGVDGNAPAEVVMRSIEYECHEPKKTQTAVYECLTTLRPLTHPAPAGPDYVFTGGGTAMRRDEWNKLSQEEKDALFAENSKILGYTNYPNRADTPAIVEDKP